MQSKMRNPLTPHRIEFGSILNHFGCAFWVFFVSVKNKTTTLKRSILTQEMGEKENKIKQSRGEIKIKNKKQKKT